MKCLLSIGLLFLLVLQSSGQYLYTRHLTTADGLPSNKVYTCYQDNEGYIWIGTDMGAVRYDGQNFKTYNTTQGLPNNEVWNFFQDSKGRLWMNSFSQYFTYFYQNKIHKIPNTISSSKAPIHYTYELKKGEIYFNCATKYYILDAQNEFCEEEGNRAPIVLDSTLLTPKKIKLSANTSDRSTQLIWNKKLLQFNQDSIFYGKFIDKKSLGLDAAEKLRRIEIIDETFFLLVTSRQRSFIINKELERVRTFEALENWEIMRIFSDKDKNWWVATGNDGIYYFNPNEFLGIKSTALQEERYIASIQNADYLSGYLVSQKTGSIYAPNDLSTKIGSLDYIPDNDRILINKNLIIGGNNSNQVYIKTSTKDNKTILSSLLHLDSTSFRDKNIKIEDAPLKDIFQTRAGGLILSTPSHWVVISPKRNIYYELAQERAGAVLEDSKGIFWAGTNTKLQQYKLEKSQFVLNKTILSDAQINDLAMDKTGRVWIATDAKGLFYYENEQLHHVPQTANANVKKLVLQGNYLFAHNHFSIWSINIIQKKLKPSIKVVADNRPGNEIRSMIADANNVYISTDKNLVTIPHAILLSEIHHFNHLAVSQVEISGRPVNYESSYTLNYPDNRIKFSFNGILYHTKGKISYQYRMVGMDSDWITTEIPHISYTLAAGSYSFQLKAIDPEGQKFPEIYSIPIHVYPPWWNSFGFYLLVVLGIIGITIGIAYKRIQDIRTKSEIEKRMAELEMQALQSQMNPHFLFNAMSAIQYFINENNISEADAYISKLARLMRLILESSRSKYISLEEEIELNRLYLSLEKARMKEKLEYEILVEDDVDLYVEIPAMLLQPYIENAILHGIHPKKTKGRIDIHIQMEEDSICMEVKDNGIGRSAAAEIKKQRVVSHKSRGTEIMTERISIYNQSGDFQVSVETLDLSDENQNSEGTSVRIKVTPVLVNV